MMDSTSLFTKFLNKTKNYFKNFKLLSWVTMMKKIALITGANSGIGLATALDLVRTGVTVCLACRNMSKAEAARQQILQAVPTATVELYQLDLASFESIHQMVAAFKQNHKCLDVLINNAGIAPLNQQFTQDGFELQFGVNYLGAFLLTHLLLPLLEAAVPVSGEARIIHVASIAHMLGQLNEASFCGKTPYSPTSAYAQSKLCNLMFNFALARRLPKGVTTQAFHPGGVDSEIWRDLPRLVYLLLRLFLISPERAGIMAVDLAVGSAHKGETGGYYSVQWPRPISRIARDIQKQDWLYDKSCELAGIDGIKAAMYQEMVLS